MFWVFPYSEYIQWSKELKQLHSHKYMNKNLKKAGKKDNMNDSTEE